MLDARNMLVKIAGEPVPPDILNLAMAGDGLLLPRHSFSGSHLPPIGLLLGHDRPDISRRSASH